MSDEYLNREPAFDPVDVLDSFADQPATLTMEPTVPLFGDTRHAPTPSAI